MTATEARPFILVVDDEPDLVTYLTTFFEDNGYATDSAKDGVEAMQKIASEKPDLITLDISIPEKSGVKVYREIKENPALASIPVLVITGVTGYGGDSDVFEKFLSTRKQIPPPEGFIAKPIDREELLGKVRELLG
ncbi:MAG: response regulator [Candidatus Omnitrophota bacterium]|jgi:CheY-like chemotaxis protein|nr:MAG: response regulator [Candidatus Omnitrophota bacterium]